ncbi:putative membrane protein [Phytophthora megakarya]|uniref:Putative membrane protein n=1 Tax=Phytophthora megakarya TaxID=4795 RepID=A0A225VWT5_9STRA|nr:putative membrane protein [Phytophthora megakarya]
MINTQNTNFVCLQATTHFKKPFFITCLDHSITVFLLPALYIYHLVRDKNAGVQTDKLGMIAVLQRHSKHPLRKLFAIAVVLNSVYLIADYMWFTALAMVSVAAGTAISNTSPFFVYLFSMCFLHEQASWKKLCGVLTSFIGVALITIFQDGIMEDPQNTSLLACMLVVTQTIIAAAYGVAYRVVVGEDVDDASTILTLTGICGMVTIPVWIVGSLLLAVCPFEAVREPWGLPETEWGLFLLMVSGVGAMMTIPLSLLWDIALNGRVFPWECFLGATLIMAGFGMLELISSK